MRVFIVGNPIQYLHGNFLLGAKPRHFSKEEIISESFHLKDEFKIFVSFEAATAYACSLRKFGVGHTPNQYIRNNLAAPIFTLELDGYNLTSLTTETIRYQQERFNKTSIIEMEVSYYLSQNKPQTDHIISAEFINTGIGRIDFSKDFEQKSKCTIQ